MKKKQLVHEEILHAEKVFYSHCELICSSVFAEPFVLCCDGKFDLCEGDFPKPNIAVMCKCQIFDSSFLMSNVIDFMSLL